MTLTTNSNARQKAIRDILTRAPRQYDRPVNEDGRPLHVSEYFGVNTFGKTQMKQKLPKNIYEKLISTIEKGRKLDIEIANAVAHAVKEWALDKGVLHFCHWFQPQTGSTAEKHDAFLTFDDNKQAVERFSGSQLIQSEPDASSFPSGGMRSTFEARGYTAWDPSSPIFIMESGNTKTLCIPSVFISYHGDALDEKTGLLRSMEALSTQACELLSLIGETQVKRILPTLGAEQEYFLIDRALFALRPDLMMGGRILLGGQPPKGQQLEDHYFGSIPTRVQAFMSECEFELYKLGVPIKTRHNEVAPNQYEAAPIFEEANVATDHNQLTMEIMRKVARRHNFEVLFHEKPFAGVNGNGKHCNWSMMIAASGEDLDGENLLDPGKTPHENLRFLLFLTAVLKGVHKHSGLLRAGIATHGNDHRLGANEAPPAIMSVFLGEQLSKILDEIEKGSEFGTRTEEAVLRLGVGKLPEVAKDNTDRNRTSPFAFTGNKFEFRAVGGSANPSFPMTLLNAAISEGIAAVAQTLKEKLKTSKSRDAAILEVIKETVIATKAIRFEGNNYSEEWVKEADRRGLPNLRKTPEALMRLSDPASKKTLTEQGVFSEAELNSRLHVRMERYVKNLMIEVDTLRNLVDTFVLPACYSYHGDLASAAGSAKAAGVTAPQTDTLNKLGALIASLQAKRATLETVTHKVETLSSEEEKAKMLAYDVSNSMADVRSVCDELEGIVADAYWPLPKYREMLFHA